MVARTIPRMGQNIQTKKLRLTECQDAPSSQRASHGVNKARMIRPNVADLRGLGILTGSWKKDMLEVDGVVQYFQRLCDVSACRLQVAQYAGRCVNER